MCIRDRTQTVWSVTNGSIGVITGTGSTVIFITWVVSGIQAAALPVVVILTGKIVGTATPRSTSPEIVNLAGDPDKLEDNPSGRPETVAPVAFPISTVAISALKVE